MVAVPPLRRSSCGEDPHPVAHCCAPGDLVLFPPDLDAQRGDVNDGVCSSPCIGVVFRRDRLDFGAGQRCRLSRAISVCTGAVVKPDGWRGEVSVTIDDHHVRHCPKVNANPSHQADVHGGRGVGTGDKDESILVQSKDGGIRL